MRALSLLLSSVALVTTVSAASAADLPSKKAAPVDYVKVCSIGSFTGFVIPGSDVCLKVGGFVRYEYGYDSLAHAYFVKNGVGHGSSIDADTGASVFDGARNTSIGGQTAKASLKLDARATTEFGLLRSFADIRVGSAGTAEIDKAYIQFGAFSFGKFQSFFDFYADAYNNVGAFGSDTSVVGAAYTATLPGGFFATVALEDRSTGFYTAPTFGGPDPVGLGVIAGAGSNGGVSAAGYRVPDLVGQLLFDPGPTAWGTAQLSGAVHQVRTNIAAVDPDGHFVGSPALAAQAETKYGWAAQAGVKLNLPMLGAGDTAYLQGGYTEGALSYVGLGNFPTFNSTTSIVGGSDAVATGVNGKLKLTRGYNVLAGIDHFWTPTFDTALFASYTKVDYANGILTGQAMNETGYRSRDFDVIQAGTQLNWAPVSNLMISATALYYRIDAKTLATDYVAVSGVKYKGVDTSSDGFAARVRVQRDF